LISTRNRDLCNVTPYRNPIGSDQDFLEYLISAEILPQDKSSRIFDSRFYFIQNPLVARYWDDLQSPTFSGQVVENAKGELLYGSKSIPFIHYQNQFCHYSSVFLAFSKLGIARFTPAYTDSSKDEGQISFLFRVTFYMLKKMGFKLPTRRSLILSLSKKTSSSGPSNLTKAVNHINFRRPA